MIHTNILHIIITSEQINPFSFGNFKETRLSIFPDVGLIIKIQTDGRGKNFKRSLYAGREVYCNIISYHRSRTYFGEYKLDISCNLTSDVHRIYLRIFEVPFLSR